MPYTKDHKSRTKDRILNSATELFGRNGFEKVSISQIMKLARMTHGAFYAHFESKEALFSASFLNILRNSKAARLVKGPFSIKQLMALVTDYLSLRELEKESAAGPESVLFNEIGSDNNEIKRMYEASYETIKKMLETRITALCRLKKLPFAPERELVAEKSRAILASLVGAVALARSISQVEEQQNILDAAQKQILSILGVSESELELGSS